jgi:outer membrane protein assembly factor BamB
MRFGAAGLRACERRLLLAVAASVATLSGCGGSGQDDSAVVRAEAHAHRPRGWDWALPNVDRRNTRQVGGPITAATVERLRVAWKIPVGATASTAAVVAGIVYAQDLRSNVSAIELATGRQLWRHSYDEETVGPNGVTVVGGRVYGATESHAFALDAHTGRELWSKRLPRNPHEGIDMAPGYHDGTVFVSTVPTTINAYYAPNAQGILWALDAETGKTRWRWAEVPADLWGAPELNGGGGLWHPPAFDDRGGVYISIGNPSPWPGRENVPWGTSRPGPNKWTNSIVKLDERTGRFLWGRQVLPHDLYDWDLECPPILTRVNGREVAIAGGKMGFVFAFDAGSGRMLWKRSVGLHNGHDHDNLIAMHGQLEKLRGYTSILPGNLGGIETPMALGGDTVYAPVVNISSIYAPTGEGEAGKLSRGRSEIVALDAATGRVKWDRRLPSLAFSSVAVVNDLVFTATYDGTVWALRRDTGAIAWRSRLPAGTNAPLTVSGDTLIAAAGVPQTRAQRSALVAYRLAR